MPDAHRANSARALATLIVLTVPAVGLLKIIVGLNRSQPIKFLVILVLMTLSVGLAAFGRAIRRTHRGDRTLEGFHLRHGSLRAGQASLAGDAQALGIGLFGLGLLDGTPHAALRRALSPPRSNGGPSESCGSSCGGGFCGGGGCGGVAVDDLGRDQPQCTP